jgi:M6 family metalloprotease-like protein
MRFSLYKIINLISITFIFAIPASNVPITLTQVNGLEFDAFIRGDEWNNWYETMDGYSISKNSQSVWKYAIDVDGVDFKLSNRDAHLTSISINVEKHLRPISNIIRPNHAEENPIDLSQITREEFEIPLVLIDYPNMPHSYPPSNFENLMNQEGYAGSQGETGSFRDLYIENSYGQFLPNSTIIGWFTAAEDYQNYGDGAPNGYSMVKQMIGQAIDEAEVQGVDWSVYDNDGDGYVDALNVLHAGQGAEEGNSSYVWSHKWNLGNQARYYDGVVIDNYTINPEKQAAGNGANPGMVHIGVLSHEFGHALGLPDLYDTDYTSSGIGTWGLMSGGSWGGNGSSPWYPAHFCAWAKYTLGWVTPIIVTEGTLTVDLPNVEENAIIYRMNGTSNGSEYFLFENRQAIGFDQTIKNTGLLIWHIDDGVGGNTNEWHRRVDLEQADGLFQLNYGSNDGDVADVWPGTLNKTYFGFDAIPSSIYYDESPSGISVVNIQEEEEVVMATFRNIPNLAVESTQFIEQDGDMDNVPNPGEIHGITIDFYNPSSNIIYDLEMVVDTADPNITLLNNESTLNDVGNYSTTWNNQEIEIQIDEYSPLELIPLNLFFTGILDDGTLFDQNLIFNVDVRLDQGGFPLDVGINIGSSPAILDITDDGNKEIIFVDDDGIVRAVTSIGELIEGWEIEVGDDVWGAPAIADLDLDGDDEIIIASKSKHLFIISKMGEIELDFDAEQFLVGTPAVGNLDDDEDLEIVFGGMDNSGKLYAINYDGTSINNNFPISLEEKIYTGVALADINNDNSLEIIVTTKSGHLHVFDNAGYEFDGFPFSANDDIRSAPIVADIDFDGQLEILFGDDSGTFYAIDSDANIEFQVEGNGTIRMSPSLQMGSGGIHIYFGNSLGEFNSIDNNGAARDGWPVQFAASFDTSPVFSDIDADGEYEIIITHSSDGAIILNSHGEILQSFSLGEISNCSPLVVDIDNDNDIEIIYGFSLGLSAIDIKTEANNLPWNMLRGNPHRTGFIDTMDGVIFGDVNIDGSINILDVVAQINHILDYYPLWGSALIAADLNMDGVINIQDIILIIDIIIST